MMFSSYFIITNIFSITINLYGDYLLDRFKLEEKYPRLSVVIKYRRKVGNYVVVSNIIYIILTCLMNIFLFFCFLFFVYLFYQ